MAWVWVWALASLRPRSCKGRPRRSHAGVELYSLRAQDLGRCLDEGLLTPARCISSFCHGLVFGKRGSQGLELWGGWSPSQRLFGFEVPTVLWGRFIQGQSTYSTVQGGVLPVRAGLANGPVVPGLDCLRPLDVDASAATVSPNSGGTLA